MFNVFIIDKDGKLLVIMFWFNWNCFIFLWVVGLRILLVLFILILCVLRFCCKVIIWFWLYVGRFGKEVIIFLLFVIWFVSCFMVIV